MVRRIRNEAVKREIEESDFISNKEKEIIMDVFDRFDIVIIKHYMKDEMFDGNLYHTLVIETNDMSKKALNNLERGLRQLEKKYDIGYEKNYNSNGDNVGTYYFYKYINDYKTESLSDKKNGEYLHYIVKITPYKNMFKFDLDNQHFDKQSYCFFDKNGKYVDTNYRSVSEKEFNKFYDKSMKPNKAYGFYYTKPFGEFLGFEEVPLRWFGV